MIAILFASGISYGQGQCFTGGCTFGGTNYPSGTFSNPGPAFVTVSTIIYAGEYQLYNVTTGVQYEWSYCTGDGAASAAGEDLQLTLFNNTTGAEICYSDDYCGLAPKIQWTATFSGVVRVLTNQFSCLTNSTSHTLVWRAVGSTNDDCANAITISPGTYTGNTLSAAADIAPTCGTTDGTSGGLWYKVTGSNSCSSFTASTCGGITDFDTKIRVYTGSCAGLTCVDGNDDFCGTQSQVTWSYTPGTTYYILVHGFSSSEGNFTLTLTENTNTSDVTPPTFNCLSNVTTNADPGSCSAIVNYTLPTCGTGAQTLYSQNGNNLEDGRISNNLWPLVDADDFTIGSGCWNINAVTASFLTISTNGSGASSFTINFYSNAGGVPGTILNSQTVFPGSWTTSYIGTNYGFYFNNFTFTLPSAVNLCAGSYFISIQANITGSSSDFYWEFSTNSTYGSNGLNASSSAGPWTTNGDNYVFSLITNGLTGSLTDNCGGCPTLVQTAGLSSGSGFPIGVTTNTHVASDANGNTTTCSFTVTVIDNVSPVLDQPTLATINSQCTVTSLTPPTATDQCSGSITGTTTATLPITSSTTINWSFVDASGNQVSQTQNVVVQDATAPAPDISSLPEVIEQCEVTFIDYPTSTDNCNGAINGSPNVTFPLNQSTIITWTFTDNSGNSSSQQQVVTINDNIAPVPDISSLPEVIEQCEVTFLDHPTSTDNCNGTINGSPDVTFPLYQSTIITWTFTDNSGNSSSQQQVVTINDNIAPVPDLTVLDDVTGSCSVDNLTAPNATDNCSAVSVTNDAILPFGIGSHVVTWTYTDDSGNQSSQQQNVNVLDSDVPVPDQADLSDISVLCKLDNLDIPTASDGCEGSISGISNVSLPIMSSTTITWTYTDGSGNSVTQDQNIIIEMPNATVTQNLATLTCQNTNSGVTYQWIDCSTNTPVSSANSQSFTPSVTGNYAVVVSESGCQDTSECFLVDYTSLSTLDSEVFKIYPNPNDGNFTLNSDRDAEIAVLDMSGREIEIRKIKSGSNQISIDALADGIYEIKITSKDLIYFIPIVVKH